MCVSVCVCVCVCVCECTSNLIKAKFCNEILIVIFGHLNLINLKWNATSDLKN